MREVPLYFVDYILQLNTDNNIQFDKDLKPEHLNVHEGDMLQVKINNGTVILERK